MLGHHHQAAVVLLDCDQLNKEHKNITVIISTSNKQHSHLSVDLKKQQQIQ